MTVDLKRSSTCVLQEILQLTIKIACHKIGKTTVRERAVDHQSITLLMMIHFAVAVVMKKK